MGDTDYSVNLPGLDSIRQALEYCHANLKATVDQSGPPCTAVADAHPAWSTSAAMRHLHDMYTANITGHTDDVAGYAASVHASWVGYSNADQTAQADAASLRIPGGV
jgi:hypothetical protein